MVRISGSPRHDALPRVVIMLNSLRSGGSQTYTLELVDRLHRAGMEVEVIAKPGHLSVGLRKAGARVTRVVWREGDAALPSSTGLRTALASAATVPSLALVRQRLSRNVTAVIASQPWPQYYAARVVSAMPMKTRPRLFSIFHGYTNVEMPPIGGRHTMTEFDMHFTSTLEAQAKLATSFGIPSTYLGNLFDADRFWGVPQPWLHRGMPPTRHIVSLSTLTTNKVASIDAVLRWLQRETSWTYSIVGGGPQQEYLKELARSLHLGDRAIFEGPAADPRGLLDGATVVVAVGRAALEAASRGIPVIIGGGQGLAGPLSPTKLMEFEQVNFTDRVHGWLPPNPESVQVLVDKAMAISKFDLALTAHRLRKVGNADALVNAVYHAKSNHS